MQKTISSISNNIAEGRYDIALILIDEIKSELILSNELLCYKIMCLIALNRYDECEECFIENSKIKNIDLLRGLVYYAQKRYEESKNCLMESQSIWYHKAVLMNKIEQKNAELITFSEPVEKVDIKNAKITKMQTDEHFIVHIYVPYMIPQQLNVSFYPIAVDIDFYDGYIIYDSLSIEFSNQINAESGSVECYEDKIELKMEKRVKGEKFDVDDLKESFKIIDPSSISDVPTDNEAIAMFEKFYLK